MTLFHILLKQIEMKSNRKNDDKTSYLRLLSYLCMYTFVIYVISVTSNYSSQWAANTSPITIKNIGMHYRF